MTAHPGMGDPVHIVQEIQILNTTVHYPHQNIFYALKEMLKAAGWTVGGSGDGTTYSPNTDLLVDAPTIYAAGARVWLRLIAPHEDSSGHRQEWIFHKVSNTATSHFRVKHSRSAGFTGGAPTGTTPPSAADEVVILGGGTDAAPSGATWFGVPIANGVSIYCVLYGVADRDSNAFWMFLGENDNQAAFAQDDCAGYALCDPVRAAGDLDEFPYVVGAGSFALNRTQLTSSTWNARAYFDDGLGNLTCDPLALSAIAFTTGSAGAPIQCAPNQFVSDDHDATPACWGNYASGGGSADYIKGWSTIWWLLADNAFPENSGWMHHTFDHEGDEHALIHLGACLLAGWSNGLPALVNHASGGFTNEGSVWIWEPVVASAGAAPAIANVTPPPGVLPGTRAEAALTPIEFDVTDADGDLAGVVVIVKYANQEATLVAFDGTSFLAPFDSELAAVEAIAGGFHFTLLPRGGWVGDIERLHVYAFDGQLEGGLPA